MLFCVLYRELGLKNKLKHIATSSCGYLCLSCTTFWFWEFLFSICQVKWGVFGKNGSPHGATQSLPRGQKQIEIESSLEDTKK